MTDAELIALAALVVTETTAMMAFNQERLQEGYAQGYSELMFTTNPPTVKLREELERRRVLDAPKEEPMTETPASDSKEDEGWARRSGYHST